MNTDYFGEETYGDIPTGGAGLGFIGLVECYHGWWAGSDENGRPVVFPYGEKGEAADYKLENSGTPYPPQEVVVLQTACNTVTNRPTETLENFSNGLIRGFSRWVGLRSKYAPALHHVTLPGIMYALGRENGKEIEFNPALAISGNGEHLLAWKAQTDALKEAVGEELADFATTHITKQWKRWARLHLVDDPTPGQARNDGTRYQVPTVTEFFTSEAAAKAAGTQELGAAAGAPVSQTTVPKWISDVVADNREKSSPKTLADLISDYAKDSTGKVIEATARDFQIAYDAL